MSIFQTLILSIVEGITEFLPISSTGHLILVSKLLNLPQTEFVKSFEIIIQLGAIMAVVVLYFRRLIKNKYLYPKILAAFLPSAIIGLSQTVSMIPGVSRAAATVIGGMSVGLSRSSAVEFSFLLAVPTMSAATGLDLLESYKYFSGQDVKMLAIGFILSFIFAKIAIEWLIKFMKNHSLAAFGVYRIILAVAFWIFIK